MLGNTLNSDLKIKVSLDVGVAKVLGFFKGAGGSLNSVEVGIVMRDMIGKHSGMPGLRSLKLTRSDLPMPSCDKGGENVVKIRPDILSIA